MTNRLLICACIGIAASALPLAAQEAGRGRGGGGGVRGPAQKHLIYVTLPGTLEGSWDQNGNGTVVLDANNNYAFVKRIPTWDVPASGNPEQVAGVTASTVTQMIYVATRGRLGAWDLTTEKKVWENAYDGQCCERPQISPNGKVMGIADTTTHTLTKTITFPDNIRPFVLNHDATKIYSNTNNLLGFVIADVKTGEILNKVEVQGFGWPDKWRVTPRPRIPHACPAMGSL